MSQAINESYAVLRGFQKYKGYCGIMVNLLSLIEYKLHSKAHAI